ncbi:MAG: hypothetical protein ABJQ41_00670 [Marinomonas sp.]
MAVSQIALATDLSIFARMKSPKPKIGKIHQLFGMMNSCKIGLCAKNGRIPPFLKTGTAPAKHSSTSGRVPLD